MYELVYKQMCTKTTACIYTPAFHRLISVCSVSSFNHDIVRLMIAVMSFTKTSVIIIVIHSNLLKCKKINSKSLH